MSDSTPGWQPDPSGKHDHRYWDGSRWTDDVADAGVASTDPYEAAAPEPPVADEPVAEGSPSDEAPAEDAASEELVVDEPGEDTLAHDPVAPVAPIEPDEAPAFGDDTVVDQTVPPADATASYAAVTDEPAAWSDAPAPPPPYVPTDGPAEGSGAKKGLLIGGGILAAVLVAVLAFTALGGDDDDPPPDNASQSSDTTEDSTDGSTDTTEGSGGAGSYGSDPELDELYDACEDGDFAACDQLYLDSPSGSDYESFGDTCGGRNEPSGYCEALYADDGGDDGGTTGGAADLPDDYREELSDIYESTLGLNSEQADCLAGKLADAIEDGTITEDQATSEFLDYLSDCDISLEEIGGN